MLSRQMFGRLSLIRRFMPRSFSTATNPNDVVIVSAVRTPIGSIGSTLADVSATDLGATAIRGAVDRVGIDPVEVQEAYFGNVVSASLGQAPARQAAIKGGLKISTPCTTVNKVCASGMKTIMFGAQSIMLGHQDVIMTGGMESMTNAPYYVPKGRFGMKYGHGTMEDSLVKDGLWDVYNDIHMGSCAEKCSSDHNISREEQDEFAVSSYKRAVEAIESGRFKNEIVPVEIPQKKGDPVVVSDDEEPNRIKYDKIPKLPSAFKKDGTVTAANASSLNDGASAVLLMSAERANALGLKPLARIRGFGDAAQNPEDFTTTPSLAVPRALKNAGVSSSDIDFHEINEAFAVVVLANMRNLGLDPAKVNVNGGAVALGHPIGCSGARIVTSLLNVLNQKDATMGAASICNGGGGASAMIIERLN
eukprot:gb/GECG01016525.1/.p1 GENE.gb/GECG01016525.1/~~gb/GECG01016525.1/.p1  ORF type:complete len:420 (+),score=45.43 gb/GECG01016525.1/:1-1260(+)